MARSKARKQLNDQFAALFDELEKGPGFDAAVEREAAMSQAEKNERDAEFRAEERKS